MGLGVEKFRFTTANCNLITSNYLLWHRDENSLYNAWRESNTRNLWKNHTLSNSLEGEIQKLPLKRGEYSQYPAFGYTVQTECFKSCNVAENIVMIHGQILTTGCSPFGIFCPPTNASPVFMCLIPFGMHFFCPKPKVWFLDVPLLCYRYMMQQFQGRCGLPTLTIPILFLKEDLNLRIYIWLNVIWQLWLYQKLTQKNSGYPLEKILFICKSEYVRNSFPPSCNEHMLYIPVRPTCYHTNTNANCRK